MKPQISHEEGDRCDVTPPGFLHGNMSFGNIRALKLSFLFVSCCLIGR